MIFNMFDELPRYVLYIIVIYNFDFQRFFRILKSTPTEVVLNFKEAL